MLLFDLLQSYFMPLVPLSYIPSGYGSRKQMFSIFLLRLLVILHNLCTDFKFIWGFFCLLLY